MANESNRRAADDVTPGRETAQGHDPRPHEDVTEGGPAPSPVHHHGASKASASTARDQGAVAGDDTSAATSGKAEQRHAAEVAATKTQSGRGHRKHEE